jgi:transcriptional regulator of acetoin/glycerol metabolism
MQRGMIAASWARSINAGLRPECEVPFAFRAGELSTYRSGHSLSPVFPLLYDVLGRAAEASDCVMAVGDHDGRLLWVCGTPEALTRAERIQFAEGAWWAERHVGTNALGTALAVSDAVQVRATEHFASAVQRWYCAAAPIRDPDTHAVLGAVDVTGGEAVGLPQTLAMIRAAAAMAEAELGRLDVLRRLGARQQSTLRIEALGRTQAEVRLQDRSVQLTARQSDILVLLAEHPSGLSTDALSDALYDESDHRSSLRGEITRLRATLGASMIASRHYRLTTDVSADWLDTSADLACNRVLSAIRQYSGPLLPRSEAPAVVTARHQLECRLREAVLKSQDVDVVVSWTRSTNGHHDLAAWEHQLSLLGSASPLRDVTELEVRRLRADFGLA